MRTILTIDDDVARLLKKKADESGQSFREVVNRALRVGLLGDRPSDEVPNIQQPRSMGGALVDLDQALSLAEGVNDDALLAQLRGWRDRPEHTHVMTRLLEAAGGGGDLVPDAHLAALAVENGGTVYSQDADFARFPDVRWVNPLAS